MPDPLVLSSAVAAAVVAAAVVSWLIGGRALAKLPAPGRSGAGWVAGIAIGVYLGCWILGVRPHWPLRDDQDRLLALALPLAASLELLAASVSLPGWLVWPSRLAVLAVCARALLHGTVYITDVTGPGTSNWSTTTAWLIFAGLAAAALAVWWLLETLTARAPVLTSTISFAGVCAGAALTVMLTGYATGGQIGLPLAGAVASVGAVALARGPSSARTGPLGLGVVALFCLLVMGRFFGELSTTQGVVLFCAPLVAWAAELPPLRRTPPWLRGFIGTGLVAAVVACLVYGAFKKFGQDMETPSGATKSEPTFDESLYYGK
jgi:hypothetical protein